MTLVVAEEQAEGADELATVLTEELGLITVPAACLVETVLGDRRR